MKILVDTNVLLRIGDPVNPDCAVARAAVIKMHRAGELLHMVPQNLFEFWAAATRSTGSHPAANGLGMPASRAEQWVNYLHRNFKFLPDHPALYERWWKLTTVFGVTGRKSFDVRLVAAMETHGLTHILTFNGHDFQRFAMIAVLDPRSL